MNRSRRTTWIVGTLTAAVLVGVVVAAWRPVQERWYAAKFLDMNLPEEERANAAKRLIAMGRGSIVEQHYVERFSDAELPQETRQDAANALACAPHRNPALRDLWWVAEEARRFASRPLGAHSCPVRVV